MGYKPQWHPTTPLTLTLFLLPTTASPPSTPPPTSQPPPHNFPLKPSMTIVVGLLTTIFSLTFLLLLYAKHCRRSRNRYPPAGELIRSVERDNSGIDRTIIESLPVFRFGSLTGQKDGLECAVCLSVFDQSEVLRLLPKCKHAFHVECVDTWLDAHSTCPLCRYRVDPEDIFLILGENQFTGENQFSRENDIQTAERLRRVSGRHSSAGENGTGLQISVETSSPLPPAVSVAGSRRSLDSWKGKKKVSKKTRKKEETTAAVVVKTAVVSGGETTEKNRKDGMLLEAAVEERRRRKRLEHRIVVGSERWSDVQPSDLLYLRSEMMMVRRLKRSRPSVLHEGGNNGWWQSGRGVINSRSVSEMTGLSRFGSNGEAGVVSRLLARLSEPKSGRNSSCSNV